MGWIIAAILLVIGGIALSAWYKSKLMGEGKIVERSKDFAEFKEIFIMRPISDRELADAVKAADFKTNTKATVSGNTGAMSFSVGEYFKAVLKNTENSAERSVYEFEFISWKSQYGSPSYANEMNVLMTAVEKMILGLDPNAQVSSVKNEVKTKRHWI